jgi:hypothetical protein
MAPAHRDRLARHRRPTRSRTYNGDVDNLTRAPRSPKRRLQAAIGLDKRSPKLAGER